MAPFKLQQAKKQCSFQNARLRQSLSQQRLAVKQEGHKRVGPGQESLIYPKANLFRSHHIPLFNCQRGIPSVLK